MILPPLVFPGVADCLAYGDSSSTNSVVEHLPNNYKDEGSNPGACTVKLFTVVIYGFLY
jgi:hypothetical protein